MTLYEKHIGRLSTIADLTHEREFYVAKLYTKEQMEKRWKRIGYIKPTVVQLSLFQ